MPAGKESDYQLEEHANPVWEETLENHFGSINLEESIWKSYLGIIVWNSPERVLRRSLELPEIQLEKDSVGEIC